MNPHFSVYSAHKTSGMSAPQWLGDAYVRSLPLYQKRREVVEAIRSNQVVIVAGETGCGKTTQLPLMCLEARGENAARIVVAQPRRIAAISLAKRVASLLPEAQKNLVGYKVRFHGNVQPGSKIVFVTDGIILAETAGDPSLLNYGTILIDEAHERTIPIDFLLGYLRTLLQRRPELKVVIASATMDTRLFSRCFRSAPVITVSGRAYPVEIRYAPPIGLWQGCAMRSYVDGVIHAVQSILESYDEGDVLAFLPTVDDIHECATGLSALTKGKALEVLKLYGRMDPSEQEAIFTPSHRRKIIYTTNIAETSVTVPHIRFVVDSGLARHVRFDPAAGITRMPVERISQASADQRAGRCGRVRDGICIRLYTQSDYASMPRFTPPEIKRSNLAGVILRLAYLGFGKPQQFPFLQHPSPSALEAGYRQLRFLGAFDHRGALTIRGKAMASLPLDPAIARMLLYARENGAFNEVAIIASALSVGELRADRVGPVHYEKRERTEVFIHEGQPKGFASDFMDLVALWRGMPWNRTGGIARRRLSEFCETHGFSFQRVKEWINVHRQLVGICRRLGRVDYGVNASYETVHKSLLSALATNIAEAGESGSYRTGRIRDLLISPGSKLFRSRHDWVLLHDITETKRPYARYAAAIKTHWIQDLFPWQCATTYEDPHFDPQRGAVMCLRQVTFNGLRIVKDQGVDYGMAQPEAAHAVFIKDALVGRMAFPEYDFQRKNRAVTEAIESAQRKMRTRRLYRGDEALIDFYSERLPGVRSIGQLNACIGRAKNDGFLHVRETDLLDAPLPDGLRDYPDSVAVAGVVVPIAYAYEPGADFDGATAAVPVNLYKSVPLYYWEWLLPVFWKPRIVEIARQMTKTETLSSQELDCRAEKAVDCLMPGKGHFLDQALPAVAKALGLTEAFTLRSFTTISSHLWLRLRVVDENGNEIETLRPPFHDYQIQPIGKRPAVWGRWCSQWECDNLPDWTIHSVFQTVPVTSPGQPAPVHGITALSRENDCICIRVFFNRGSAYGNHRQALRLLLERALNEKIAWAWRDFMSDFRIPYRLREGMDALKVNGCLELIFHEIVLHLDHELPADPDAFIPLREKAVERIALAGPQAVGIMTALIPEYEACFRQLEIMKSSRSNSILQTERLKNIERLLAHYTGVLFNPSGKLETIRQFPRYLRGFLHRMRMASDKPMHYDECAQSIGEFRSAALTIRKLDEAGLPDVSRCLGEFEEMIEEYALAMFGHGQIGTRFPVSEQRLRRKMEMLTKTVKEGLSEETNICI
jgi:ATP-dependent helicase HrpA